MSKSLVTFIFAVLLLLAASCSRPLQDTTYLYNIRPNTVYPAGPVPEEYRVRVNDHLYIQVVADDPLNATFLNLVPMERGISVGSGGALELYTYQVDEDGNIAFLLLGQVHVEGLTVNQIRDTLQGRVDQYLTNAAVFVKVVQRTITVLGEVDRPGQYTMTKSRLSIFEAIGTAGDLTDYANFHEVMLLRDTPQGKLVAALDLASPKLIDSPYYYILPNDVLYVKLDTKVKGSKHIAPTTPVVITLSAISTAAIVISLFLK